MYQRVGLHGKLIGERGGTPVQALAAASASSKVPLLGAAPLAALAPYKGPEDTLKAMADAALGPRGEKSLAVRQFAEWVLRDVCPKDYLGEILAIRNCLVMRSPWRPETPLFRYLNDPRHVEMVKDPERMVEEIKQFGSTQTDCDEGALMAGTLALLVGREVEFVALGFEPKVLSHVGTRVKEPKTGQWIWIDGVAGPREREAAQRAQEILTWSLD